MDNQKENSEILLKATGQGFSIAIHGIQQEDKSWKCSVEENEITYTELPTSEHTTSLGERRDYEKTDFKFTFEEAFKKFDLSEWFLCHPGKLHPDFAKVVIANLEKRMDEYDNEFPADTAMERFFRKNKIKEWQTMAGLT